MINASQQFHDAVFGRHPKERVLCLFSDPLYGEVPSLVSTLMAWTGEEIKASAGIKVMDSVNESEELTIGQCNAAVFETTLMNYGGLLTNYVSEFSYNCDCNVMLGVQTERHESVSPDNALCFARVAYKGDEGSGVLVTGHAEQPYLRIEGFGSDIQPPFAVHSVFVDEDFDETGAKITCIGINRGEVWACRWAYGKTWNEVKSNTWDELSENTWQELFGTVSEWVGISLSTFMGYKLQRLAQAHRSFSRYSTNLYEFDMDGVITKWEYKSLGVFQVDRPKLINQKQIQVTGYDKMILFDEEVDDYLSSLSYPITIRSLYEGLCEYVGAEYTDAAFMNQGFTLSAAPDWGEGVTGRDVLSWIAELACCNARMNRAGQMRLAWFVDHTDFCINPSQIFSVNRSNYEVSVIDKLEVIVNREDGETETITIGTGSNIYRIENNPLFIGTTKAITTAATAIYERLHSFSSFAPIEARCVCDWTVQSGDIISIMDGDQKFSLPIYAQTISWKGGARVVYENSGSNKRPKQKGSRYSGNIATMKGDAMIRNLKRTIKQMSEQLNTVKEAVNAADK